MSTSSNPTNGDDENHSHNAQCRPTATTTTADDDESSSEEEAKIQKAIRFWKHPSMQTIPENQKRVYLYEKGVTDAQIHKAWERILDEKDDGSSSAAAEANRTTMTTANNPSPPTAAAPSRWPPSSPQPNPYPQPQQHANYSTSNPYTTTMIQQPYYSNPSSAYNNNNNNYPNNNYGMEEDGPMSLAQGSSLVALGGILGLTAAAAARWLNGGTFEFLPPPSNPSYLVNNKRRMEEPKDGSDVDDQGEEEDEDYIIMDAEEEDEEYTDNSSAVVQEQMLQQIESLSETMKSHVGVQEKLLQKLSNNNNNSAITNSSMDLLRSSNSVKKEHAELLKVWAALVEIKAEMSNLNHHAAARSKNNGGKKAWEEKLTSTSSHLESCMERVEEYLDLSSSSSNGINPSTTKPVMPSTAITQGVTATASTATFPETATTTSTEQPLSKTSAETTAPVPSLEPIITYTLRQSIRKLAEENESAPLRVGAQLLYLYIVNLSGNPDNPRYRKIFTCNESFQKVEHLEGGKDLLVAVGFEEQANCLEWLPNGSTEQEILGTAKLKEAAAALSILKSGKKSNNLTESALKALSPDPDVHLIPPSRNVVEPLEGSLSVSPSPSTS